MSDLAFASCVRLSTTGRPEESPGDQLLGGVQVGSPTCASNFRATNLPLGRPSTLARKGKTPGAVPNESDELHSRRAVPSSTLSTKPQTRCATRIAAATLRASNRWKTEETDKRSKGRRSKQDHGPSSTRRTEARGGRLSPPPPRRCRNRSVDREAVDRAATAAPPNIGGGRCERRTARRGAMR